MSPQAMFEMDKQGGFSGKVRRKPPWKCML